MTFKSLLWILAKKCLKVANATIFVDTNTVPSVEVKYSTSQAMIFCIKQASSTVVAHKKKVSMSVTRNIGLTSWWTWQLDYDRY